MSEMREDLTEPIDTVPAKVLIQVREGVPNVIHEFDLPLYESEPVSADPQPGDSPDAKLRHTTKQMDLARALHEAGDEMERQARLVTSGLERPAHEMVVELDRDTLVMRIVCNDEACMYRWTCAEDAAQCEVIYDVQPQILTEGGITGPKRDVIVGYTHAASYYRESIDDDVEVRHEMVKTDECSFVEIAAGDPSMLPEMNEAATLFEVGRFAVKPVWMGEDGANWIRPEDDKPLEVTP